MVTSVNSPLSTMPSSSTVVTNVQDGLSTLTIPAPTFTSSNSRLSSLTTSVVVVTSANTVSPTLTTSTPVVTSTNTQLSTLTNTNQLLTQSSSSSTTIMSSMPQSEVFNIEDVITKAKKEQFMNPVELLRFLQKEIMIGRVLDITDLTVENSGETNHISVDRDSILKTTFEEFKYVDNFRKTFEVDFMGEECVDLGGPRKEWIRLMNRAIYEKYFEKGLRNLLADDYYYVGAMLSIALLQNGQLPNFISEEILQMIFDETNNEPCIKEFCRGLGTTGLDKVLKEFPMTIYFFRPGAQQ